MKILIVGAGLSGLALAGFLERCGVDVVIIEKRSNWEHEGYSLGLWNNGRAILEKLGLGEIFDEREIPFQNFEVCDGDGRLLHKYNLSKFYEEFGMAYSHVRRADLHAWLLGNVKSNVRMGISIESICELEDRVDVVFSDQKKEVFDLVVGADGVHSRVRDICFQKQVESYINWRVWYVWVSRSFSKPRTVSEYVSPGELVTVFDEGDKALVVLTAHMSHSIWDAPEKRIGRLKEIFKQEVFLVPAIFNGVKPENILPTDLVEISLKNWHTKRIVLIGDAAHGFEPFAGLGGSMALEDAYILAGELAKLSQSNRQNIAGALKSYEHIRRKRVARARKLTTRMQFWAIVQSSFVRKIINLVVPFIPQSFVTRGYFSFMRNEI
jgi:2-polyprenyl-6-methoxyphenol hydroxylase-like FAD-dependent oxidoreductase